MGPLQTDQASLPCLAAVRRTAVERWTQSVLASNSTSLSPPVDKGLWSTRPPTEEPRMDPTATPAPQPDDVPPAVLGELVVGNGRLIATRRASTGPLTLIGDGSGCDVRLHHDKVAPFHCALFHGPHGFVLRDLAGPGQTLGNGEPVQTAPLNHGDCIAVG